MSLRCAIPEPNLWTAETPFTYGVTVELRHGGKVVETRSGAIKFRTD
jgi:beta-galactosidase/beta-glucuronidase